MEWEPMLTPSEQSTLPEKFSPEEDRTHNTASSRTASPTRCQAILALFRGFPTRMVYLYYISCLRYTILAGNPQFIIQLSSFCQGENPLGQMLTQAVEANAARNADLLLVIECLYLCCYGHLRNRETTVQHKIWHFFCKLSLVSVLRCELFSNVLVDFLQCSISKVLCIEKNTKLQFEKHLKTIYAMSWNGTQLHGMTHTGFATIGILSVKVMINCPLAYVCMHKC